MDFPHNLYGDAIAAGTALTTDLALARSSMASGWKRQRRTFPHNASTVRAAWQLPTATAYGLVRWLEANSDWFNLRMISGNDHWQTCSVFMHEVRRTSEIQCARVDRLDQFVVTIDLETRSMVRWEDMLESARGAALHSYPGDLPLPQAGGFNATHNDTGAATYTLTYRMNTETLRRWMAFAGWLGASWFQHRMVSPGIPCGFEVIRFVTNPQQTLTGPDTWDVTVNAETMSPMYGIPAVSEPGEPMPPPVVDPEPDPVQYDRFELVCMPMNDPIRMVDHVNGDWIIDGAIILMGISPENVKFPPYGLRVDYQGYTPGSNAPRYYNIIPTFRPSNFSYRVWVRSTDLEGAARVLVAARTVSALGARVIFSLSIVGTELWAQLGNIFLYAPANFLIDTHHFVEMSVDANQTIRIFMDGNLIASVAAAQADFVAAAYAVDIEIRPIQKTGQVVSGVMYMDDMAMDRNPSVAPYTPPTLPHCGGDAVPPPASPPVFMAGDAPNGTSGVAYSFAYALSGGVPPLSARFRSGGLPPGIAILPSGVLIGQSVTGTYSFTLETIDSVGTISAPLSDTITIVAPPPTGPTNPPFNPGNPKPPVQEQ